MAQVASSIALVQTRPLARQTGGPGGGDAPEIALEAAQHGSPGLPPHVAQSFWRLQVVPGAVHRPRLSTALSQHGCVGPPQAPALQLPALQVPGSGTHAPPSETQSPATQHAAP